MTGVELLPILGSAGALGVFAWVLVTFHRSAIRAERSATAAEQRRADDWKASAHDWQAVAQERDRQIAHILGAVDRTTGTAA